MAMIPNKTDAERYTGPTYLLGNILLEHPNERGHDQRHEPRPERGHGADIRIILLRRCRRPTASTPTEAGSASEKDWGERRR